MKKFTTLNTQRGAIGALQNRMGYAAAIISISIENKQASESIIRDVDMAFEMVTFTKNRSCSRPARPCLVRPTWLPRMF